MDNNNNNNNNNNESDSERLKQFLSECRSKPVLLGLPDPIYMIAQEAGMTLNGFMMRGDETLDLNVPLTTLGVDSLVSIELRNWFRKTVGVEITVLEAVNAGSLMSLGEHAVHKLKEKYQARAD